MLTWKQIKIKLIIWMVGVLLLEAAVIAAILVCIDEYLNK